VTVPGCIDGLETLATTLGRLPLAVDLEPAIALARDGFEVSSEQAAAFSRRAEVYSTNPAVAGFYRDGIPAEKGDHVRRESLAATLEAVAREGRVGFYEGVAGEDISEATSGLITRDDLSHSQADWIEPIGVDVAGLTSWTIPANSQGYLGPGTLAVFEMLGAPDDPEDPDWWHLIIESYRCLAWERNDVLGDPDHLTFPPNLLLDRARLERAAGTVSLERTGIWPRPTGSASGTAYLCVADSEGMAVSIIQSNYRGTGSPFGARRSGFLLHDRGTGFSLMPGHPNELAPGRRPLHTLSPTLWTSGDQPRWILGTRGGAVQPQLVAQVAARAILGSFGLDQTQAAPRWTQSEFGPGSGSGPVFEPGVDEKILSSLRARGHSVQVTDSPQQGWGPVSIIELAGNTRRAAPDPRVDTATAVIF
jgi:gamma-glutamyltranspeptidase/glutathione hydrolase